VQLGHYLSMIHRSECELGDAFAAISDAHGAEAAIHHTGRKLADQCRHHAARLAPIAQRYRDESGDEPDDLHTDIFRGPRSGPLGVLRDLHDLYLMAAEIDILWTLIAQAAQGARDDDLLALTHGCEQETAIQMKWCKTQLQQRAPQVLVVVR
jgi:hypothetical protein